MVYRPLILLLLSASLLGCVQLTRNSDERYFTWVDETGQVRHSPIRPVSTSPVTTSMPGENSKPRPQPSRSLDPAQSTTGRAGDEISVTSESSALTGVERLESGGDRFDVQHYPDAVELEERGNIRSEEDLPFVSWRDADGIVQTTRYRPQSAGKPAAASGAKPGQPVFEPSAAMELYPGVTGAPSGVTEAWQRLGIDRSPNLFEALVAGCCRELANKDLVVELPENRSILIEVDAAAPSGRFAEGVSHYRVVNLGAKPAGARGLRLRSYSDKRVFIPTLIFLDAEMNPVRVVTDVAWRLEAERWHRHGFIEAGLSAEPGERGLLIMTRPEDLRRQFVTETEKGLQALSGDKFGQLSLEWLIR